MALEFQQKPANATYLAKAKLTPDGDAKVIPASTGEPYYDEIVVTWYENSMSVTIPHAAPAAITQAYLSGAGRDVIVEIKPVTDRRV